MVTSFKFSKKKLRKTGISRRSRAVKVKKCTKKYVTLLQNGRFRYKHFCRFCRSCRCRRSGRIHFPYLITQGVRTITLIWFQVAGSCAA